MTKDSLTFPDKKVGRKIDFSYRSMKKDWPKLDKMTELEKSIFFYLINKYRV